MEEKKSDPRAAAASFGTDISTIPGEHFIQVSPDEQQEFEAMYELVTAHPYDELEEFILQANLLFHELPKHIRSSLVKFHRFGNREGALLIRGLPQDPDLPGTPSDSRRSPEKQTWFSELWLSVFSTPLGNPIGYIQEQDGEIFQNKCPTKANEDNELSGESSKIVLSFHTEHPFHPYMPDYVMLYCLRQDHDKVARTPVASIRKINPHLTPSQIFVLRQPLFDTAIDFSFGNVNATKGKGQVGPILWGDDQDPYFKYDPDLMIGMTPEAASALQSLSRLPNKVANYALLQPGDLMIIDNNRAVHARTGFTPRYDGMDRWLQRVHVLHNLAQAAAERVAGGRVIGTEFAV